MRKASIRQTNLKTWIMKKGILRKTLVAAFMLLAAAPLLRAERIDVSGRVTDADRTPLLGVIVRAGAADGVLTDVNGNFLVKGVERGSMLTFSYIGYKTRSVAADSVRLHVVLESDNLQLEEECVVVGYGTEKQSLRAERMPRAVFAADCGLPLPAPVAGNGEAYAAFAENRFRSAQSEPLSTFSIDVDGASYGNLRRMIGRGETPPQDAVRIEEMVNYFTYGYKKPEGNDPVAISTETGICPWNEAHRLVRIGIKAREIASEALPASNFVFLIDVSGSMYGPDRLGLVVSSMKLLINNLRDKDRVGIVTYCGSAKTVLESVPGSEKQKIRDALEQLEAGGSTAGGAGIQKAYDLARRSFIDGGNNRVILCTDGDFNVGVSSEAELERLIAKERQSGVFLTVLGYGLGNYKDGKLQTLAEKGNGNHAYIDDLQEANRVLVNEFGSTMHTVAKDVKLQIEFNPARVQTYRLIGYESRLLNKEDFNDDTKDAGEIGAGHCVTALYEVVPAGAAGNVPGSVDPLKYQSAAPVPSYAGPDSEMLTVKLRYKEPDGDVSKKMEVALVDSGGDRVSSDFRFASAVAMFGQLLRNSDFRGKATYDDVIALARRGLDDDPQGYRREFIRLVETVKNL